LEYLFEAAKAYVKGEKPDVRGVEQHAKAACRFCGGPGKFVRAPPRDL
jgi:hypothetical protein